MRTWNTIARSKSREWERKAAATVLTVTADRYVETLMETPRKMGMGDILRLALGDRADHPEGLPYTHTLVATPYGAAEHATDFFIKAEKAGLRLLNEIRMQPHYPGVTNDVSHPKTGDDAE